MLPEHLAGVGIVPAGAAERLAWGEVQPGAGTDFPGTRPKAQFLACDLIGSRNVTDYEMSE